MNLVMNAADDRLFLLHAGVLVCVNKYTNLCMGEPSSDLFSDYLDLVLVCGAQPAAKVVHSISLQVLHRRNQRRDSAKHRDASCHTPASASSDCKGRSQLGKTFTDTVCRAAIGG